MINEDNTTPLPEVESTFAAGMAEFRCGDVYALVTSSGLVGFSAGGRELLEQGPRADIWRAPTAADRACALAFWREQGYDRFRRRTDHFSFDAASGTAYLHQMIEIPGQENEMEFSQSVRMLPGGALDIENIFVVPPVWADLPRLGLSLELPGDLQYIEYCGNGPDENYADSAAGAVQGCYRTSAADMFTSCSKPQDCGVRTQVGYAVFSSGGGAGLRVEAPGLMEFSALPYSSDQLEFAMSADSLRQQGRIFVHMDVQSRGRGGGDGRDVAPEYRITPGRKFFHLVFKPVWF